MTYPPPQDPLDFLVSLVRCPSVTPSSAGTLDLLSTCLRRFGFRVHLPVFSEPGTPDVCNLFASIGNGAPHLMFAGHVDVVPPGDEKDWMYPPFAGEVHNGVLYGRGAVDMKGSIACFMCAVQDFLSETSLRGSISFLITCDEEGPGINGTQKLLRWTERRGEKFDAAIVGEATSNKFVGDSIKVGRRGSLSGKIKIRGKHGHVACTDSLENPIRTLSGLLHSLCETPLDTGTVSFPPSNLEFLSIETDYLGWNVTPSQVRARFNVRFNDIWNKDSLMSELRERVAKAVDKSMEYNLSFESVASESFLTDGGNLALLLSEAIASQTGKFPAFSTDGGTSDARFIKDYCQVVEFGLLEQPSHQVDESVAVSDLGLLRAIYGEFLRRFFLNDR